MNLPPRTVERLSKYRRLLEDTHKGEHSYFFSHHLAKMLNLTPVQVRRDLMLIGLSGNHRKGYNAQELIKLVGETIDREKGQKLAIVGMGNLGRAVSRFIRKNSARMDIIAGFDIDASKISSQIEGVACYDIESMPDKIMELSIDIIVLTTPADTAQSIVNHIVESGVRGILNFTSVHLDVPQDVYLKNYDILTSLEEIGFFINNPISNHK